MKRFTRFFNYLKFGGGGLLAVLLAFSTQNAEAQTKTYLTGQKTGNYENPLLLGVGGANITAPIQRHTTTAGFPISITTFHFFYGGTDILTGSTTASTTLRAENNGLLDFLGAGANVYLQFRNTGNAPIGVNKKVYFKLGAKPVNTGLNVNLGTVLGLENIFNIQGSIYQGAGAYNVSGNGNENNGTAVSGSSTKLIIDKENQWHAQVTPPANTDFNSVRLKVSLPDGLNVASLSSTSTTLHNAFTMSEGNACSVRPIFTSYGNSGISLTVGAALAGLDLGQLVADAHLAIDDSPTTYSKFSNGLANVGVANTIAQEILFDHTASASDAVKIHLSLNQSVISLDLLSGGVTFKAYKGASNTPVATQSLQSNLSLIGLNLANILTINSGYADINTTFKPGVEFDRVEVSFNGGLINATVIGDALRLYDVELAAPAPTISSMVTLGANNSLTVYAGAPIPAITATSAGNEILWYEGTATTPLTGSPIEPPHALPVTSIAAAGDYVYYAAARKAGCTNISAKVPVNIKVLPIPTFTNPTSVVIGTNYTGGAKSIIVSNGQGSNSYTFSNPSGLPAGLTLNTDGSITGTPTGTYPTGANTVNFTADVTDATLNKPVATGRQFSIVVYPALAANAGTLPNSFVGASSYPATIPVPTGGSGATANYNYEVTGGVLPAGLTLNANGTFGGSPSTANTYSFTVTITDPASGSTVAQSYTNVVISPKLELPGGVYPTAYVNQSSYSQGISVAVIEGGSTNGSATGGIFGATLTYSLAPPVINGRILAFPSGFDLAPDGTLTGNPSATGVSTNTFTVYVTDGQQVASNDYTLIIESSLPVKLASFKVIKEGEAAQLSWSTTSESNSERFEVQRSRDGKEWKAIGSRDAKGESAAIVTYSFTDATPLDGENLYRLKMIDRDATFALSGIQSVRFAIESLKLYPNPVANAEPLTIQVKDWGLVKTVKVFNALGTVVFESAGDVKSVVSTEQLAAGLYVVQVTRKDGQIVSSKFVKR